MVLYVILTIVIALLLLNAKKEHFPGSAEFNVLRSKKSSSSSSSSESSSSSSTSSSASTVTPLPPGPSCPDCPNADGCCGNSQCGRKLCPPLNPGTKPGCKPDCKKLVFVENFKTFQDKLDSGNWSLLVLQDPTNPLATITFNDGRVIQECDGAVFDSRIYSTTTSNPFPVDDFHYGVVKSVPYATNRAGYSLDFTVSEMTKYTKKVLTTPWGIYFEGTGADPEADYRLAGSSVGIMSTNTQDDTFFIRVVLAKKQVYLTYGVETLVTNRRDRFAASIPLLAREGRFDEKFSFSIVLNWDGSFQVFQRLHSDCSYKCLLYVPNVGIPPSDRRYIVKTNSRTFTVGGAAPVVIYEPFTVTTTQVTILNTSNFDYLEPLPLGVPKTALYQVDPTVAPTDTPLRYLCECDSSLLQAEAITTLPTAAAANTLSSHYGQGATIKVYNLETCYV
jgi:hypothetical protein